MSLEAEIRSMVRQEIAQALAAYTPPLPAVEQLLTSAAVAKVLGCTRRAFAERLRRARCTGDVHALEQLAIVIDGARRWRRSDVEAFIREQKEIK